MNDNKTILYRIRRKEDGLFLVSAPSRDFPLIHDQTPSLWNPTGCFWKSEDTIRKHLLSLCMFRVYIYDKPARVYNLKRSRRGYRQKEAKKHNPFWVICAHDTEIVELPIRYHYLEKYEVIATEITEHGSNIMEAREFASFLEDIKEEICTT